MSEKTYICIDLKSFYASVECVARGLDPLTTNLLVADVSKTEGDQEVFFHPPELSHNRTKIAILFITLRRPPYVADIPSEARALT